jgi:hypothetical protein
MGILFCWPIFALIGAVIGQRKGMAAGGLILGLVLGPIGCLIAILARGKAKTCPHCGETVRPEARICRFCHSDLSGVYADEDTDVSATRILIGGGAAVTAFCLLVLYLSHQQRPSFPESTQNSETPRPQVAFKPALSATANPEQTDEPTPPPTPTPPAFLTDVTYSQRAAVAKYPQLGVAGSPMNRTFLKRLAEWQGRNDPRLNHSNWPENLANACATNP